MRYLLDTNILSDLIRNPDGLSAKRLAAVGDDDVVTSAIVAAELRYGVAKKRSNALAGRVKAVLDTIPVLPFEPPADAFYGDLRAELEKGGRMIGANDLLIAAQALALGLTLVTDNVSEFSRITSLSFQNWLR
jgi:tRNA(fMet)-specific endonuclease VapC